MIVLRYFMIFLLILGLAKQMSAFDDLLIGVRPMGLSGAFTAIADDVYAISWNPAGITQLNQHELAGMWANIFHTGFIQSYLGYALPINNKLAVGSDWMRIQFDDKELAYSKDRVHLTFGYRPYSWFSCGFNFQSVFSSTTLDKISEGGARRFDGDIGVLLRPLFLASDFDKFKLAFVLRDIANRDLTHEYQGNISYEKVSARKGIIGLSYETPINNLIVSAETDVKLKDRICFGGEYRIGNLPVGMRVSVRSGLHKYWDISERPSFAFGGSIDIPLTEYANITFEYAYLDSPVLSDTHRLAIRIPFDFNPTAADIAITDYSMPLFASLYKRYAKKPTLAFSLFNKQDRPLKLQVSLSTKEYYSKEGITLPEKTLARKQKDIFILPIVFSNNILDTLQGEIPIDVEVTYPEESRFKPARKTFSVSIFPKGKVPLTKQEGVKPYAAFITYEDQPVVEFARKIVEQYDEPKEIANILSYNEIAGINDELRKFFIAIEIYEALRCYGIYYRPDANEADEITKLKEEDELKKDDEGYFVDTVRYPREFLLSDDLGGDCDDWSVLYASLLESQGIETALVDVPGHVFVMFNTGIPIQNKAVIGLRDERYIAWHDVLWDKTIWIPIDPSQKMNETGMMADSFYASWSNGLRQCGNYIAKNAEQEKRIAIVRSVQAQDYPPASLAKTSEKSAVPPSRTKMDQLLTDTFSLFYKEWKEYMLIEENLPR